MSINAIISSALSWGYGYPQAVRRSPETIGKSSGSPQPDDKTKQEIEKLKKTDQDVKTHEQAHMSAGGQYVRGGATYEYQTGPDGKRYAVGGEVSIDTSPVKGDPAATIQKMQAVRAAALAPADPSAQDRAVASQAARVAAEAMAQKAQNQVGGTGKAEDAQGFKAGRSPFETYSSKAVSQTQSAMTGMLLNMIA